MSNKAHLQKLITNHTRRLQKLKEQRALIGIRTDPAILIEIEDIETELEVLQEELAAIKDEPEPHDQSNSTEEIASPNAYQIDLRHIETQLDEVQIKLAALERRFKDEDRTESIGVETPGSKVQVQLPPGLKQFDSTQIALVQQLYQGEQQVLVEKEFGGGFGGTRVFLVRPIDQRGRHLARQIVKIGPPAELKREQQNYLDHVKKAHPYVAAEVARFAEWQGLGGIIYNFVGDSRLGQTRTLEEVFLDEQVSADAITQTLTELLDKALGEQWYHQTAPHVCFFDAEYGPHLVEHLRVRVRSASQDGIWPMEQTPDFIDGYNPLSAGDIPVEHSDIKPETLVHIEGLVITKVKSNLLKLQHPTHPGIVVKVETPVAMNFTVGQAVTIRGEVRYNRPARLTQIMTSAFANFSEADADPQAETLTWNGQTYPNPLHLYPKILSRTLDGKKSLVHGDLHLRNILVDESGHGWLIDFALVKERHNLYDFIKLEVYIRQMVLSQAAFSFADYLQFEEALLDEAVSVPDDPILRKAYWVIQKVRELAVQYVKRDFIKEYLPGLFLYSLAVVKYVESHGVKSARLAFGTAGVVGWHISIRVSDGTPKPIIENPTEFALPSEAEIVLKRLFSDYQRVVIKAELDQHHDKHHFLIVRPIMDQTAAGAHILVKLAAHHLIEKEKRAYQSCIGYRSSPVAQILGVEGNKEWGGLSYSLPGHHNASVPQTLDSYLQQATFEGTRLILKRLFDGLKQITQRPTPSLEFHFRSSYERILNTSDEQLDNQVRQVMGSAINPTHNVVSWSNGPFLTNPLHLKSNLLRQVRDVNLACIHGNLNLKNILVDKESNDIRLINFSNSCQDHALHDFLKLETEIITKLVPQILHQHRLPAESIYTFYNQLHHTINHRRQNSVTPPNQLVERPWLAILAVREAAQDYLFIPRDWSEYYQGLTLYLLGSLASEQFKITEEISNLSKKIAFWGAATIGTLLS
ncbi:MAG: phosphotransferase [Anaerolineae bacterium]|nr:phosphotransferase [Anaerolineae bacterium]